MSIICLIATIIMMCSEKLSIVSYNSGGLGDINREIIEDILTDSGADILLLQETWLLQRDLGILNSFNTNLLAKGKSSVRDNTILCGRPYGGLGILWNKSLSLCVKPLSVECDWVDGIYVTLADGKVILVLNVYLPVDPRLATYTTEEYEECIAVLDHVLQTCPYDMVLIGGDFNTDLGRNNAQTASLTDFFGEKLINLFVGFAMCWQKQQWITNSVYLQDPWFTHVLY